MGIEGETQKEGSGALWFRRFVDGSRPWLEWGALQDKPKVTESGFGYTEGGVWKDVGDRKGLRRALEGDRHRKIVDVAVEGCGKLIPPIFLRDPATAPARAESRTDAWEEMRKCGLIVAGLAAFFFYTGGQQMIVLIFAFLFGVSPMIEAGLRWWEVSRGKSDAKVRRRRVQEVLFGDWVEHRDPKWLKVGVGVLGGMFLLQLLLGHGATVMLGGLVKEWTREGQWWRVVTSGLLHGDFLHILFNGMALFSLGRVMMALVHPGLVLIVFVWSVVGGSLASVWFGPEATTVGASGGIMGLIGFLAVVSVRHREMIPYSLRSGVLRALVMVAVFGVVAIQYVDNAAHGGGFLVGAVLGMVMMPRGTEPWAYAPGVGVRGLAWVSGLILVLGILQLLRVFYVAGTSGIMLALPQG